MTPDALIAMADKIDNRLGPISGRDADKAAVLLREAASKISSYDELRNTASEFLEASGCCSPMGDGSVKAVRAAMKYMATVDAMRAVLDKPQEIK